MRLADNELEVFHELLEQMESELAQELVYETGTSTTKAKRSGKAGEEKMVTWFRAVGFTVIGHLAGVTQPGPDGVAWRRLEDGRLLVLLLDNKELTTRRAADKAPGLQRGSLSRNLGPIILSLRGIYTMLKRPYVEDVAGLLEKTWLYVVGRQWDEDVRRSGRPNLPSGVMRVITNGAGEATGITTNLQGQGFEFLDIAGKAGGVPPALAARLGLRRRAVS
jgi:hypothetical protein